MVNKISPQEVVEIINAGTNPRGLEFSNDKMGRPSDDGSFLTVYIPGFPYSPQRSERVVSAPTVTIATPVKRATAPPAPSRAERVEPVKRKRPERGAPSPIGDHGTVSRWLRMGNRNPFES